MASFTPERMIQESKRFIASEFGKEVLRRAEESRDSYLAQAMKRGTPFEEKALLVDRAAGVSELIDMIKSKSEMKEADVHSNLKNR